MGGRGTFAAGKPTEFTYRAVGEIEGVKVLEGLNGKHDLPVESHKSSSYIQLYPDGNFKMMRFYNREHYLVMEIAYHPEPKLDGSRKSILHIHEYQQDQFLARPSRLLTEEEYRKFKKYLKGATRWKSGK